MAPKITEFAYGDLNPVLSSKNKPSIDKDEGFFDILKRTAEIVHTPDSMEGIIELRGIVLSVEKKIKWKNQIPQNSWISDHYFLGNNYLPEPLQAYKIYIPELHAHLPRVRDLEKDKAKIERYPTFIASSSGVEPASAGQLVRITFTNVSSQEGPIYLGPIFNKPIEPVDEQVKTAIETYKEENRPPSSIARPPDEE